MISNSLLNGIGLLLCLASNLPAQNNQTTASGGPPQGALVVHGGGGMSSDIIERFIQLAGGPDAPVVFVPTASENEPNMDGSSTFLAQAGMKNVTVLHTRDRAVANTDEFIAPLRKARAVWFGGGRQWRFVDSYLGTLTEQEFHRVLQRGGVIGGSSSGATIQGSYLVRGAREGPAIMMAPGYEQGFGFLRQVAVDQHIIPRSRENDMWQVIRRHPELLGIGIDEGTAIIVQGDTFEVVGRSKVFIYDAAHKPENNGTKHYTLSPGERFDLKHRKTLHNTPTNSGPTSTPSSTQSSKESTR